MTPPLTTPQAVKDAAVKIARAPKMWTPHHGSGFFPANDIHCEAGEAIALTLERLPVATDDRDEKIAKAADEIATGISAYVDADDDDPNGVVVHHTKMRKFIEGKLLRLLSRQEEGR